MAIQSLSSSSSISYGFTYQVFLSFRGTDTRHGFTGNLYKALTDKGIHTFIDDNHLPRGNEITPSLIKAIEESRIFIPIFSTNYASSSFCLDELVHIIHCYKTKGRLVLPVFFGVEPTNVRHQTGIYGEALAEHEKRFQNDKDNVERLQRWKVALNQAANLSGYHFSPGYEYQFIGKIVEDISDKINRVVLHVAKYPVGLQSRVQQVKLLLDKESNEGVHMVGLYGTGGLGKSTLAKAIYNYVADQFECVCFLHKVRENSTHNNLKHLQEELLLKTIKLNIKIGDASEGIPIIKERLCRKKILLILDDVDKMEQLEALAGGLDWFGRGSRVVITTRDKHLLTCHRVERTYEVEGLYGIEALELLRWLAFKDKVPLGYEEILNRAVLYASGLPLVIEIVGSNLFGKSIETWKSTLDGYEKIPNTKIQEILKVSYDALEEEEQSVFLDIACCFKGCKWTEVEDILHAHYGHCIKHHVGVLVEKSLIKINSTQYRFVRNHHVTLHDLVEDMGKEIVRQESSKEPGERSRLWCHDDIVRVLQKNNGTSNIEMIYLNCPSMEPVIDCNVKSFKKMTKLKTLIIENGNFSKGPKYLPSSLRVLKWKGCTSESLSSSIFSKKFDFMKVLTFDNCEYLTHLPNVSGLLNLEKFSVENCNNLITIHDSIGKLNKIEILNAKRCIKLESFPPLQLPSLKELELSYCRSLKKFPELLCKMTNLKEIAFHNNTSIGGLPFSFENLSELRHITIYRSGMLRFPKHIDKMYAIVFSNVEYLSLYESNLSYECLPMLLKWFVNVKHLDLSKNNFKILPECLNECHLLRILELNHCKSLEEIRGIPPNLKELYAIKCHSLSSSSRRMLLSQKLHEAGCTEFLFPNGREGIPDWFEHQSRGHTLSFWFRKKIPSITCILLIPDFKQFRGVTLVVNHNRYNLILRLVSNHTILFDLKLEENIEMDKWILVELRLKTCDNESHVYLSSRMGIHVKGNTEENVIFTNPYRETKSDEYLNTSLSENKRKRKKFSQMGIQVLKEKRNMEEDVIFTNPDRETKSDEDKSLEVSETENVERLSLEGSAQIGLHMLKEKGKTEEDVIFRRKRKKFCPTIKKHLALVSGMGINVLKEKNNTKEDAIFTSAYRETKSDEDKSLEISETKTVQRQNLEVSETEQLGRCDIYCMSLLFERIASLFAR